MKVGMTNYVLPPESIIVQITATEPRAGDGCKQSGLLLFQTFPRAEREGREEARGRVQANKEG